MAKQAEYKVVSAQTSQALEQKIKAETLHGYQPILMSSAVAKNGAMVHTVILEHQIG